MNYQNVLRHILHGASLRARSHAITAFFLIASVSSVASGQVSVLHNFVGTDGMNPQDGLIQSGGTLFGVTAYGGTGTNGGGTIFSMNTDGSDFQSLHSFNAFAQGESPEAIAVSGSTLYGVTYAGGNNNSGTLFSVGVDGSNFNVLNPNIGGNALVVSGSTIYVEGSTNVYSIGTNGQNYTVLATGEGVTMGGGLILSGSTLYGAATDGGMDSYGSVFKVNTDGTGFSLLHSFSSSDGESPVGVTLINGTLYGTTFQGSGLNVNGNIYEVGVDGSNFSVLHSFASSNSGDSASGLVASGNVLYGSTSDSYSSNDSSGGIFSINANGTGYSLLQSLDSTGLFVPRGALLLYGNSLYGESYRGGISNNGGVFQVAVVPEPSSLVLLGLGAGGLFVATRRRRKTIC